MVFDLNNLPAVLDLKLGHKLVVVGILPRVRTHWAGLLVTFFKTWFCCSGSHDGEFDPGKLIDSQRSVHVSIQKNSMIFLCIFSEYIWQSLDVCSIINVAYDATLKWQ